MRDASQIKDAQNKYLDEALGPELNAALGQMADTREIMGRVIGKTMARSLARHPENYPGISPDIIRALEDNGWPVEDMGELFIRYMGVKTMASFILLMHRIVVQEGGER